MKQMNFFNHFQSAILHLFIAMALMAGWANAIHAAEPVNPLLKEFTITVDPSALQPTTHWHVPGITPLIWTMDPINMEAHKTTEIKQLNLKPGNYRFGTFTFDFLFTITLSGSIEYAESLDQCVRGRGTQVLTILCTHTQPYPQDPDYYK
jgi:hypothetical protein